MLILTIKLNSSALAQFPTEVASALLLIKFLAALRIELLWLVIGTEYLIRYLQFFKIKFRGIGSKYERWTNII